MEEGGGITLLDRDQTFERSKLNSENMFNNKRNIKNTFPVVVENPLGMIQAFPNNDRKQTNMINEMTGYFSEYGNLTILLDTSVINNENSCNLINSDKTMNNCYIIPDSPTIEPASTKVPHTESVQIIKKDTVANQPKVPKPIEFVSVPSLVSDMPEYIDINALAFTSSYNHKSSLPMKNIGSIRKTDKVIVKTELGENISKNDCTSSDDEVVFIKEYRVGPQPKVIVPSKVNQNLIVDREVRMPLVKKLAVSPKKSKRSTFVPRRNPKRKAQLQKNYDVDFEFDFSFDNADEENIQTDYSVCSVRRSQRTVTQPQKSFSSGSSTSSANSPIPNEYMREWPVDGMHERPNYNPLTGEIEKYDHVPKPKCKPATRTIKKGKRRTVPTDAKKKPSSIRQKLLEEERINQEFAILTHETFHDLIDYVKQFKRARELMDKNKRDSDNNVKINESLQQVQGILLDNSIFYCLANNVSQKDLAKYFVSEFKKPSNES